MQKTIQSKYAKIIIIFLCSRITYGIIIAACGSSISQLCTQWDSEHYLSIAQNGYTSVWQTAFFPLIPVLIRFIGVKGLLIVNQAAFFAVLFLLYSLTAKKESYILQLFAFGSCGFFSMIPYTEVLLLFLTLLVYYLFTKRRFGFIFGCIMGIAVTVKSIAAMLYFAVFIGMCVLWHAHKLKFLDIIRTYIPATIISCLYPFYLQVTFGSWKSFIDCQYDYWKRMKINPVQELYIQLKTIFGNMEGNCVLFRINEVLSLTIVCFILYEIYCYIRSYKTRQNDLSDMLVLILYVLFSLAAINATIRIPSYNAPTTSFYRYYYSLFPIYLLAENMSQKKKNVVYACSTAISFITAIIFIKNCYFY